MTEDGASEGNTLGAGTARRLLQEELFAKRSELPLIVPSIFLVHIKLTFQFSSVKQKISDIPLPLLSVSWTMTYCRVSGPQIRRRSF
ncbi:hypothetical protein O9929_10125 [Vibrio lentus]|nr:hypothetical protein [Vibrio lentus]